VQTQSTRNAEIDRLRALALLVMLWVHALFFLFPQPLAFHPLFLKGWGGTQLFFVISGFVVTKSLQPLIDSIGRLRLKTALHAFYLRRIFRILPLSYLSIGLFFLSACVANNAELFGSWRTAARESIAVITFTYNFASIYSGFWKAGWFWSLSVEEHFYLLLPLFLAFVPTNRQRVRAMLAMIFLITFVFRPLAGPNPENLRALSHLNFDCTMAGCLIYFFSLRPGFDRYCPPLLSRSPVTASLLTLLATVALLILPSALGTSKLAQCTTFPLVMFLSAGLVTVGAWGRGLIFPLPGTAGVLNWIGTRSYGIYLLHLPIWRINQAIWVSVPGRAAGPIGVGEIGAYVITAVVSTVIASEAAHRWIERPLMQYGHRRSHAIVNEFIATQQQVSSTPALPTRARTG
jgi:peptidoglycan/LPS O-acetylase OafA/YrhL